MSAEFTLHTFLIKTTMLVQIQPPHPSPDCPHGCGNGLQPRSNFGSIPSLDSKKNSEKVVDISTFSGITNNRS